MTEIHPPPLRITPIINYPREMVVGKTYVFNIDFRISHLENDWPFNNEEYPLYITIISEPYFSNQPNGEPSIVIHRFGGSYGAVSFLVRANKYHDQNIIHLIIKNEWGIPVQKIKIEDIRIVNAPSEEQLVKPILLSYKHKPEDGLVLILNSEEKIIGLGGILNQKIVVTSAHVIKFSSSPNDLEVTVYFPKNGMKCLARVSIDDSNPELDVAILFLTQPLPLGVSPLNLGKLEEIRSSHFQFYSINPQNEIIVNACKFLGRHESNIKKEYFSFAIMNESVRTGISGAPIFDQQTNKVIGFIRSFATGSNEVIEVIPTEEIVWFIPELNQLSGILKNPFIWHGPIPNNLFVGRKELIKKITERLNSAKSRSINVIGPRRIGKSSLLNYLHSNAEELFGKNIVCLFLDFSIITLGQGANFLIRRLIDTMESLGFVESTETKDDLLIIQQILNYLEKGNKKIIVLIDEFDGINNLSSYENSKLCSILRYLASTEKFELIISSRLPVEMLEHFETTSPLANVLEKFNLNNLKASEWNPLIKKYINISESELSTIDRISDGHPAIVQMTASFLWESKYAHGEIEWEQQAIREAHHIQTISALRQAYLRALRASFQYLSLIEFGDDGSKQDITMEQIYIDLDTTRQDKSNKEKILPLSALSAVINDPRSVLLGDPGSGKSTFVRHLLSHQAAAGLGEAKPLEGIDPDLVPILINFRDLVEYLKESDISFNSTHLKQEPYQNRFLNALKEQIQRECQDLGEKIAAYARDLIIELERGQCFLVMDGLDEVPFDLREPAQQIVAAVIQHYHVKRIIVTCRIRSYSGSAAFSNFAVYTLAPFNHEKIKRFASAWYETQYRIGRISDINQVEQNSQNLFRVASKLEELASNPFLLTSMALISQRESKLPNERVGLFRQMVDVLIHRWQQNKLNQLVLSKPLIDFLSDSSRLNSVLDRLGYEACFQGYDSSGEGIPRSKVLAILEGREFLGTLSLSQEFLDYIDHSSGLLVGLGNKPNRTSSYSFPHRSIQEYFAGCFLVDQPDIMPTLLVCAKEGSHWNSIVQIGFEELYFNRHNNKILFDLADQLSLFISSDVKQTQRVQLWAGQIAALVNKEIKVQGSEPLNYKLPNLALIRNQLVNSIGGELSAIERCDAGNILARLGDPRKDVITCEGAEFCIIPSGAFLMGEEYQQHLVELPDYWLGRHPVTNAQFDVFVASGGYNELKYWSNEGIRDQARYSKYPEPFNLPNHPVVGISWHEALAFSRWLNEMAHERGWIDDNWEITLPSEAEWEKAARGGLQTPNNGPVIFPLDNLDLKPAKIDFIQNPSNSRVYPWGNSFDSDRANTEELGLSCTSTVGCFQASASPYGILDMCGNVWQWTSSADKSYPYNKDDGRENIADNWKAKRILRGGAYPVSRNIAQSSYRLSQPPQELCDHFGFRLAIIPTKKVFQTLTLELARGVNMLFTCVPGGEFIMGSDPKIDKDASNDELPQHKVILSEYWIAKYPVTVEQFSTFVKLTGYKTVVEWKGSSFEYIGKQWRESDGLNWTRPGNNQNVRGKEQHPVTQICFEDAIAFCNWVTKIGKIQGVENFWINLPTEAEWEKAARGTDGRLYPWGNEPPNRKYSNFNKHEGNTSEVGNKSPLGDSPYGCSDMSGNVYEWCSDWYDTRYYAESPYTDPTGPVSGKVKSLRGGSWIRLAPSIRAGNRAEGDPGITNEEIGFRCALHFQRGIKSNSPIHDEIRLQIPISQLFTQFVRKIEFQEDKRERINLLIQDLDKQIRNSDEIGNIFVRNLLFGSIARNTALRDAGDIDIMAILNVNPSHNELANVYKKLDFVLQNIFLGQTIKGKSKNNFKGYRKSHGNSILVDTPEGLAEFLPAIQSAEGILIPDVGMTRWVLSGHESQAEFTQKKDIETAGAYTDLIKIVKYWARLNMPRTSGRISNFTLECIVAAYASINHKGQLPDDFCSFLTNLNKTYLQSQRDDNQFSIPEIGAPNKYKRIPPSTWSEFINLVKRTIVVCIEAQKKTEWEESYQKWIEIFGSKFSID